VRQRCFSSSCSSVSRPAGMGKYVCGEQSRMIHFQHILINVSLPFPHHDSLADKEKQTLIYLRASSSFTLALQRFRFSPGFPESFTVPKLSLISAFHKHTPEAETYAGSQNESPKTNPSPKPEPYTRILSAFPKPQTGALPEAI